MLPSPMKLLALNCNYVVVGCQGLVDDGSGDV